MDTLVVIGIVIVALLVVVGVVLTRGTSGRRSSAPSVVVPVSTDVSAEIDRLLASGNKIAAIKAYREATGTSLADAKNRVDAWQLGPSAAPHAAASLAPAGSLDVSSFRASLPAPVVAQIDGLLASGRPIEAIKLLRENSGLGLAESKRVIDHWAPGAL